MTKKMSRDDAIREIARTIGRFPECKFRTNKDAAAAAGISRVYFGQIMGSKTMPIPAGMLAIAGLELEETTYRRKV